MELHNFAQLVKTKCNPISSKESFKCIELEHLESETGRLLGYTQSSEQASIKNCFEKGDTLFGKLRPYLKKFFYCDSAGVCSSEIWAIRAKSSECFPKYLYYIIQTERFFKGSMVTSGTKMPRADWKNVKTLEFSIPATEKQHHVVAFLEAIEKEIALLVRLKDSLHKQKSGLMSRLFAQGIAKGN